MPPFINSVNFVKWSSQGMLRMSCEAMNELFQPTVSGIIQHIGECLSLGPPLTPAFTLRCRNDSSLLVPGHIHTSIHCNETQNHLEHLEDTVWWVLRTRRDDMHSLSK